MIVTAKILLTEFPTLLTHVSGDLESEIAGPCPQTSPLTGHIAYTSEIKYANHLIKSDLSALVIAKKLTGELKPERSQMAILETANPYLAMALINKQFFPVKYLMKPFQPGNRHPKAIVHPEARVHATTIIEPGAVIHDGVKIGPRSFVGSNTVIEANVSIGEDCFIHPQVFIGHSTCIGDRVEIKPQSTIGSDGYGYAHDNDGNHYRLPHYGELIIEDDVHIGANVNIDRGTYEKAIIGAGTKIDNHCHFGHNIKIGKNCLITAGMITAGSVTIGNNCVFGGRTIINGGVNICDGTTVGPLSGIHNDITKPGVFMGYPPVSYQEALKIQMSLPSLPKMRRQLTKILKKLGLDETPSKS